MSPIMLSVPNTWPIQDGDILSAHLSTIALTLFRPDARFSDNTCSLTNFFFYTNSLYIKNLIFKIGSQIF